MSLKNNRFFLALNVAKASAILALLVSCLLLLPGCGFKLRSQQSLPPQLHAIYFQADQPYGPLEVALKKELRSVNITILTDATQAPFIFHIGQTTFVHSSDTSGGPTSQARIYHLTMSTTFSIANSRGKTILEPQTVTATRDLALNINEVFDTSTQVEMTKQIMRQELITKIFNLLSSQKAFKAFEK